jgi:hypothetical protein
MKGPKEEVVSDSRYVDNQTFAGRHGPAGNLEIHKGRMQSAGAMEPEGE